MKSYEVITPLRDGGKKPVLPGATIDLDDDAAQELLAVRAIRPSATRALPLETVETDNTHQNRAPVSQKQPVRSVMPAALPVPDPGAPYDAKAESEALGRLERAALIDIIEAETVDIKKNAASDAMIAAIAAHRDPDAIAAREALAAAE